MRLRGDVPAHDLVLAEARLLLVRDGWMDGWMDGWIDGVDEVRSMPMMMVVGAVAMGRGSLGRTLVDRARR